MRNPLQSLMILLVTGYRRAISPLLQAAFGPRCRFHPSCSEYALEALRTRGFLIGTGLSVWRILRCQPFSKGGLDPVPARRQRSRSMRSHGTHDHPAMTAGLTPAGATRAR